MIITEGIMVDYMNKMFHISETKTLITGNLDSLADIVT